MEDLLERYKDDFNEFLDSQGEINIGSFSMAPSIVLETMDEASYREQLIEFIQEKKIAHQDTVYNYFPAPIAYFFERTNNSAENEHHQFQLLRSTWESVIYILFATVLGEIHKKTFDLTPIRIFQNQRIRNNHNGTLGDKLGWKMEFIQKVLEYDRTHLNILRSSGLIKDRHIELLKELNQERNSYSHISALQPSQVKERFDQLLPRVEDLLFDLDFLENVSIIRFKESVGSMRKIRFSKFDGHSLRKINYQKEFSIEELSSLNTIFDSENMLMEFDGDIFCVSPFLHFIKEGVTEKVVICYYKKINRDNNLWIYELIAGAETEVEIDPNSLHYNINDHLIVRQS